MAVSLQQQQGGAPGPLSDLELARQLQQEEYQQQQQLQQQGSVQQVSSPGDKPAALVGHCYHSLIQNQDRTH